MPIDKFINQRKSAWQRLEALGEIGAVHDPNGERGCARLALTDLDREGRDLVARAESCDPRLINYLNSLVIRAHGRIYRADAQGGKRIRNFLHANCRARSGARGDIPHCLFQCSPSLPPLALSQPSSRPGVFRIGWRQSCTARNLYRN